MDENPSSLSFFFFNDTATTEIYTLSLHDALPIWPTYNLGRHAPSHRINLPVRDDSSTARSEEHTSELQSPCNLVCRLLLEKKKKNKDMADLTLSQHKVPTQSQPWRDAARHPGQAR